MYWADFGDADGHEAAFLRPAVVVQCNAANASVMDTVLVCPCTTTLRRNKWPGNVELAQDEAGLPKRSLVEVTLLTALDRACLHGHIGRLSEARMRAIVWAIHQLVEIE